MPIANYFNGFDTIRIGADGVLVRLVGETFDVVELPGLGSLGTVESDEFGTVASETLTAAAGVVVRVSHDDYPETFERTLAVTVDDAHDLRANAIPTFVAEDLNTGETAAVLMELWARDEDNPETPDQFLGYGRPGEMSAFPMESFVGRNFTFYGNPITATGERRHLRYEDGPSAEVEVTSTIPGGTFVESVELTMPAMFGVSGSPGTGVVSLDVTLANQAANTIFANATGSSAAPTFVGFAANTFPGRSSTGNIAAKPITDNAFALLSASFVGMRTHLGLDADDSVTFGTVTAALVSSNVNITGGSIVGPINSAIGFSSYGVGIKDDNGSGFSGYIGFSDTFSDTRFLSIELDDGDRTLRIMGNTVLSGTNTGNQTITLTGDVTGSGTGTFDAAIANNAVTLGKMATMATASLLGRNTAGTGNVEVLSASTARTVLGLGTMALQNANAVNITGGSIVGANNSAIGFSTYGVSIKDDGGSGFSAIIGFPESLSDTRYLHIALNDENRTLTLNGDAFLNAGTAATLAGTETLTNKTLTSPAITTSATLTNTSVGATSTDGFVLQNTTTATSGNQKWSPRLRWTAQGWKTDATAASRTVDFVAELVPVQGAANPTANLVFSSQVNAGGYTNRASLTSAGVWTATRLLNAPTGKGITTYIMTDSPNAAPSTTNLNPGILFHGSVDGPSDYYHGADLGYNATTTRYSTRLFAQSGGDIEFSSLAAPATPTAQSDFTTKMLLRLDTGNLKLGGVANRGTTEGTNHIDIFNGTAPVGTLSNGVSLYSASGELRSMDAAGNSTLLSPHDEEGRWIYYSKNTVTGEVVRVRMEALMEAVDELVGGGFFERYFEKPDTPHHPRWKRTRHYKQPQFAN